MQADPAPVASRQSASVTQATHWARAVFAQNRPPLVATVHSQKGSSLRLVPLQRALLAQVFWPAVQVPAGVRQTRVWQASSDAQAWPHWPQLAASVFRLTHAWPHSVNVESGAAGPHWKQRPVPWAASLRQRPRAGPGGTTV
jgi:hypothetical protein